MNVFTKIVTVTALSVVMTSGVYANEVNGSLNTNNANTESNNTSNSNNSTNSNNINQNGDNHTYSGTVVNHKQQKLAPAIAPSYLTSGGTDVCLGSRTGSISLPGFGASGGETVRDANCELIKQVKLLIAIGLKDAAVALLIQSDVNANIRTAIEAAHPELAEKLDPQVSYNKKRIDDIKVLIARYEEANLPIPEDLLEELDGLYKIKDTLAKKRVERIYGEEILENKKTKKKKKGYRFKKR